jgi:hypothetical protein
MLQALAQRRAQVLDVFLVHREVGVARHAELGELAHLAPRKHAGQVGPHDARQRDKQRLAARHLGRHADQARQHPRHLDDGDRVFAAESVLAGEANDEVERLVRDLGKGMSRIQPYRNQERLDLALIVVVHPFALCRVALAVRNDVDALAREGRHQLVVVERVLPPYQRMRHLGQALEGLHGVVALVVACGIGDQVRRRPDLEEFVEVGRNDAQVAQALDQRHFRAVGPVEHPLVEGQDAVVAVEQRQRRLGRDRRAVGKGWQRGKRIRNNRHGTVGKRDHDSVNRRCDSCMTTV